MCTASWLTRAGALHLFFNRDELLTREPAAAPQIRVRDGTRWAAPVDGRAGGTWIAVSEAGLVLALLNRSEGWPPPTARSRGHLISELVSASGRIELAERLLGQPLAELSPFRLLTLRHGESYGLVGGWDGRRLELSEVAADLGLLCSSGLGDERATSARGAVWERHRARAKEWTPEAQREFHRDHSPRRSAWSVCMHRREARSVSFTEIRIDSRQAALTYHDAPPCADAADRELRLPRSIALARSG